jgi:transcriptional regulator with XRE-family HTH domain
MQYKIKDVLILEFPLDKKTKVFSSFAHGIKVLLHSTQSTYQQLAIYLDVDTSTISRYANGKTEPPISVMIKIADYFSHKLGYWIPIDVIIGRTRPISLTEVEEIDIPHRRKRYAKMIKHLIYSLTSTSRELNTAIKKLAEYRVP